MSGSGNADSPEPGAPLWHGRLGHDPAGELWEFTTSLPFDVRLAADDVEGSLAHVGMLVQVGLLDASEQESVETALRRVGDELADGTFVFAPTDEDIHTAVERRVTELAGPAGAKLHTGRSRNDQVALDLRLYLRREGRRVAAAVHALQEVLVRRATDAGEAALPGYTHLQRAQPVLLAHHLLAHFWALARDLDRWRDALERMDVSPLGAGALAGSSLPVDPAISAASLGFPATFDNSLDAVSDRDFVAEALFVLALTQVHLSRLGEEIVLWSSAEFGFLHLADEHATGSSMLPQKKNPDTAELARGRTGRLIGNLTAVLVMLKGLPLAYNRDLQDDKEPLFDSLDGCHLALSALTGLLDTCSFDTDRMADASGDPLGVATDLAEHLVRGGMPFREAHAVVGELVRRSLETGTPLAELAAADDRLAGTESLFEPGAGVRARTSPGGAGPEPVAVQLAAAGARLDEQWAWLEG